MNLPKSDLSWCCAMANVVSFAQTLKYGQVGEGIISKWLQSRGFMVFPAYQLEIPSGKGPQLFSHSGDLVLPDMLLFRSGKIFWCEAKRKTAFTWYRKKGRWTTGIDLRHYQEYIEVACRTGLPVWLLFYHPDSTPSVEDRSHNCPHECPVGLFGGNILRLVECESHQSDRHGKSGMVYWGVGSLTRLASAEELQAPA